MSGESSRGGQGSTASVRVHAELRVAAKERQFEGAPQGQGEATGPRLEDVSRRRRRLPAGSK